jgi:hypothetical protein
LQLLQLAQTIAREAEQRARKRDNCTDVFVRRKRILRCLVPSTTVLWKQFASKAPLLGQHSLSVGFYSKKGRRQILFLDGFPKGDCRIFFRLEVKAAAEHEVARACVQSRIVSH